MITLTENAVAAVKTALSLAATPAEDRIQDLHTHTAPSVVPGKQPFPTVWAAVISPAKCERAAPASHRGAVPDRPRCR
jgi:hypothetical protein